MNRLGHLSAAVGDRGEAVRVTPQRGLVALRALGARDAQLAATLGTTLDRLRRLAPALTTALPSLRKTVCESAPIIRYTEPYTDDVVATIVGMGSASNSYDAVGHLIRLTPLMSENALTGLPDEVTQAAYKLMRSGLLGKASPLTWNPIPKPGVIGTAESSATGKPAISGPKALAESGYRYPRVQADC